jgi:hypothetical protein
MNLFEGVDGFIPDAARRLVDHTFEGFLVGGVHQQAQIRHHILHFFALVE